MFFDRFKRVIIIVSIETVLVRDCLVLSRKYEQGIFYVRAPIQSELETINSFNINFQKVIFYTQSKIKFLVKLL